MKKPLKTVLIGAGGFAETYLKLLLDGKSSDYIDFTAVVDPYPERSSLYENFKDKIAVYNRMDDCYNAYNFDFTIISTPINLHYSQSIIALEHGSHVMCEKPLVPSVKQLDLLEEKCRATGKTLSVGFQQSYSTTMRNIKKRIMNDEFGKPVRFKIFISWPKLWDYYERAPWAGRLEQGGELVRDSVITNATSHYLHNILFLLGRQMDEAANIENIVVECYKANDIETFDTIAMRGEVSGAEINFIATHASNYVINPVFVYEFERASITANLFTFNDQLEVHHANGHVENLGSFYGDGIECKPLYTAQSILGEREFDCPAKTVRPFTEFIDKLFSQVDFNKFPDECIIIDTPARQTYMKNLHLDLLKCFNTQKLPSEEGFHWAKGAVLLSL